MKEMGCVRSRLPSKEIKEDRDLPSRLTARQGFGFMQDDEVDAVPPQFLFKWVDPWVGHRPYSRECS